MITKSVMGNLPCGSPVDLYTLTNASGAFARIATLGGCLLELHVPDAKGELGDVLLGYDDLSAMQKAGGYMGMLIGRFGNRIGGATFDLNGKTYVLAKNDGENHLHGGLVGFDKYIWAATIEGESLKLAIESPDGDEGYPGKLAVTVTYTLTEDNALRIRYQAVSDQDTVINLTNHAYFNLSGPGCESVNDHIMQIEADLFTEVSSPACIPTGRLIPVDGTPFDLRQGLRIADGLTHQATDTQMGYGNGYDHNFVIRGWDGTLRRAAKVTDPASGRLMEVWTDQPGIQFYGGNGIGQECNGKLAKPYQKRQGLCLETQHYPDAIHHPAFPTCVLKAGEAYDTTTEYRFFAL
ncbi:MAG: galactose mutarotase [Oscillospiraceae bacterium]|jgi:aldose 1-epimerase|nr:galactose mutarotase [Oscillospiraceae bacterium]